MEKLVKTNMKVNTSLILCIDTANFQPGVFKVRVGNILFNHVLVGPAIRANCGPRASDVISAIEEVFYEEMHPFIFDGAPLDQEVAKFKKYEWANEDVRQNIRGIFIFKGFDGPIPQIPEFFKSVSDRVAQVSGENNLIFGKNDFEKRIEGFLQKKQLDANAIKYIGIGVLVTVVIGSIYRWYTAKSDEQDAEEGSEQREKSPNKNKPNRAPKKAMA